LRLYLVYTNGPNGRNPLVDGAYRARAELSPELVAEMDALLSDADGIRADPFWMAQDTPTGFEISDVVVDGDSATVLLATSFAGHELAVTLIKRGDAWLIRHITRPGVEPSAQSLQTGEALAAAAMRAQAFYDWYLPHIDGGQDGPRSIL